MIPFNCPAVHHEQFRHIRRSTILSFRYPADHAQKIYTFVSRRNLKLFGAPLFSIYHIFVAGHTVISLKLLAATFLLQKIGDRALETADHGFLVCEKLETVRL